MTNDTESAEELSADEQLLRDIDRNSPTWVAVVQWAEARRAQSSQNLHCRSNSRDDDMFYRGNVNTFGELLRLANAEQPKKATP